jgi:hypothetical protein
MPYQTREWLDHFLVAEDQEEGAVMTAVSVGAAAGPEPARCHFQAWPLWDSQRQREKQSPDKQIQALRLQSCDVTLRSLADRYLHFWRTFCFHYQGKRQLHGGGGGDGM